MCWSIGESFVANENEQPVTYEIVGEIVTSRDEGGTPSAFDSLWRRSSDGAYFRTPSTGTTLEDRTTQYLTPVSEVEAQAFISAMTVDA